MSPRPFDLDHLVGTRSAWAQLEEAGREGPLDPRTRQLVALAVAIGARSERAVVERAGAAIDQGVSPEALEQVVRLAAPLVGRPAAEDAARWIGSATPPATSAPVDMRKPDA